MELQYSAKTQTFCSFEDPNLCGFYRENGTDDFSWHRHQGKTPSSNTGPEFDHTCRSREGHYMYIEASGKSKGNKARLYSPRYRGLSPHCVEFYYHMYGRHIGTLNVFIKMLTSEESRSVWRVFGNQGNLWIKAGISITEETARSGYQLVFEGAVEQGFEGDISIDDLAIEDGICSADKASPEPTPKPLSEHEKSQILKDNIERYRKLMRKRQRLRQKSNKPTRS